MIINRFQNDCQPGCRVRRHIRCCGFCDSWRHCSNCHGFCCPCLPCPCPCPVPPEMPNELFTALLRKLEVTPEGNFTSNPVPGAMFTLYRITDIGLREDVGRFTTSESGEIVVHNLRRGSYLFLETFPGDFWEPIDGIREYFFNANRDTIVDGVVTVVAYNRRISGFIASGAAFPATRLQEANHIIDRNCIGGIESSRIDRLESHRIGGIESNHIDRLESHRIGGIESSRIENHFPGFIHPHRPCSNPPGFE